MRISLSVSAIGELREELEQSALDFLAREVASVVREALALEAGAVTVSAELEVTPAPMHGNGSSAHARGAA